MARRSKTRSERAAARARRRRNQRILWIGIAVLILGTILFAVFRDRIPSSSSSSQGQVITTASGLQYEDLVVGEGVEIQPGQTASVHYVGTLLDGSQFDSSRDRGVPFDFTIGVSSVIQGWHEGIAGMRTGGIRRLTIPPELGYGPAGSPPVIPPNATLIFEVELLEIR